MVYIYYFNTSYNRLSYTFKYPIFEANLRISFSNYSTWVINPTNTQIKQNRFFREVYPVVGTQHLFSAVLWIIDKQFIANFWL